jgi:flagellar M-ring protein FliF
MLFRQHLERIWSNLAALGGRRLTILGIVGLLVALSVGGGTWFLSRPSMEALYTGLSREDVGRIGSALRDANVPFDVSSDGTTVLVSHGNTAQARMLLAEKGLPQSSKAGYELFNDLGSLGLTSFMQEVTKVRALEGELARTIQSMKGIKSARVHIVLPDQGAFRRDNQTPSASVVIRTEPADDASSAQAIRHLVSAAIPGLKPENVTVMNTEGALLASGDEGATASKGNVAKLEKTLGSDIQSAVRRTLAPYLGIGNFEISVSARLNTDRVNTSQVIFDPESKVERSTRSVKESESNQNRQGQNPTTVQQNLPAQNVQSNGSENTSSENQRREEVTNFEISSKTIQTVSDGYAIRNLSVAVLVNRARIVSLLGENASQADIDARVNEIEQLVASAAGFEKGRGDQIKVAAVSFIDRDQSMPPVPGPSFSEIMARQMGTIISAGVILLVCVLFIWFGLRPGMRMLLSRNQAELAYSQATAALAQSEAQAIAMEEADQPARVAAPLNHPALPPIVEGLNAQRKLEHIVNHNPEQAASVLRKWLAQETV